MPQALLVQVVRGGQLIAQHQFDLTKKVVKIGRSPTAQIRVEDPAASRVHAVLEIAPTGVALVDLGTALGTLVNGTRVNRVSVGSGDQIGIGETTLVLSMAEVAVPTSAPGLYQLPPTQLPATPYQSPPTRPTPSPFGPPPGQPNTFPTRPAASPVQAPPASNAVPFGDAPAPSQFQPRPAAPLKFSEPEGLGSSEASTDDDPMITRMSRERRRRLFAIIPIGGVVVIGGVLVALFMKPASDLGDSRLEAGAGDSGPAPGDPASRGATGGDASRVAGEPTEVIPAAFDAGEPKNEAHYLYYRVAESKTLEVVATELYGSRSRLPVLTAANPKLETSADMMIAVGVELRVPRFVDYAVKRGDTLSRIAAAELGAEDTYPRILEANKEQLESPEALAVGMTLRIPLLKPAP